MYFPKKKMTLKFLKTTYYSVALCLFIWGSGWLLYEYAELYSYLNILTFQNVMFVALGTALLFVVLMMSPQKSEFSKSKQNIKVKRHTSAVSSSSKEELEAKLWNTKPGSKERREILRRLEELEND
jgi:FtsH-binding integral membrane protein